MEVVKKINNNVAICTDSKGNELIAFGRGIGFPTVPYILEDLSKITRTFYHVNEGLINLLNEIPEEIFEVSAEIVDYAVTILPVSLNPNLVFSLADHINFALIRLKQYKELKMVFSYDVEQLYPAETEVGRFAVSLICKKLYVQLPECEVTNIAMHFINAEAEQPENQTKENEDTVIEEIGKKLEQYFEIEIDKGSFDFYRFAMHMRYLFKRMKEGKQFIDENEAIFKCMKEEYPDIYECAVQIDRYIHEVFGNQGTEDEIMYLMIHITRIVKHNKEI